MMPTLPAISMVTHHLTAEGLALWPDWIARLRSMAQASPGFVSLQVFDDLDDPETKVVVLEMASADALQAWRSDPDKAVHLRALAPLAQRPYQARRLARATIGSCRS